jgi:homoserine dehydrogenase
MVLQSSFADKHFLYGKGAGRYPTASAVLSDISALRYDYKYEYRKYSRQGSSSLSHQFFLNIYVSFEQIADLELKDFELIEEFRTHTERSYLTGIIGYEKLVKSRWIGNPTVSIIVCPQGVIENMDGMEIKKKSLELAGVSNKEPVKDAIKMIV